MHFIKDYFETYNKVIRLEDVPEEMYGGALPVAKGKKSKRKETSKEEYLEVEKPAKKSKKGKAASDKLKIGGSVMPLIEEEVQDLGASEVLNKRTRSGKAAASVIETAPEQPQVPKKKRKPAIRKIKESPYVVEEVEGVEASTNLVTRELKKKKEEEAAAQALQKALKLSKEIEVLASSFVSKDVAAVATEAIQVTEDLQQLVTSDAENLMMVVSSTEDVQKDVVVEPVAVVDVASDSSSLSLSSSSSSSSSSDSDDIPIGQRYPKLTKSQSTTTKTCKKPSQAIPFEPIAPLIYEKIGEMYERRYQVCERLPLDHPLQPQIIQPLNMVVPDKVSPNSQRASEIASEAVANEEVTLESPQQ
jgi:hypothetical protein